MLILVVHVYVPITIYKKALQFLQSIKVSLLEVVGYFCYHHHDMDTFQPWALSFYTPPPCLSLGPPKLGDKDGRSYWLLWTNCA